MKVLIISLFSSISEYKKIQIEKIERTNNLYNIKLLYREFIQINEKKSKIIREKILELLSKFSLINYKIVINYYNDGISFFNINFQKTKMKYIMHNIDLEMNKLIPNYNDSFENSIVKIKNKNNLRYRVILYPKQGFKKTFQKKSFLKDNKYNCMKINKIKPVFSYELCESIGKKTTFEKNVNIGFVHMNNDAVIFYVMNNGFVIETFYFDIEDKNLQKYNENFEYSKLLKYNDEYFRRIAKLINDWMNKRNVFRLLFMFSDNYHEYLKKLIINNISLKSQIIDYKYFYIKGIETILNEK